MTALPSTEILGTVLHPVTLAQAVVWARQVLAGELPRAYVCHINVHSLMAARTNLPLAGALAGASLAAADGMPLVWLSRRRGYRAGRVYGPDFMQALLSGEPCRHFLYGSTPEVLDRLARTIAQAYPHAELCGMLAPPFGELDDTEIRDHCRTINGARPDVVWVGLGAPKQEIWMARSRMLLEAPLVAGVGAAFDFLAGTKPQAPKWLRQAGLEWAFRLATEPRRLAGRYLATIPQFLLLLAAERFRFRR